MSLSVILRRRLFLLLLLSLLQLQICEAQRQRVDGGSNSYTQYAQQQQQQQQYVPTYSQYNSVQGQYGGQGTNGGSSTAQHYSQQQPQQYYSYNSNTNNGYGGGTGGYQQQQSPQYAQGNYYYSNGNYPQSQYSGSYPQSSQYSSSSAQSSPYAYGQQTVVVPSSSQGAGGQYGTPQQQPIPIVQSGGQTQQQQQLTQFSGNGGQQQQLQGTQYGGTAGTSHGTQQYNGGQGQNGQGQGQQGYYSQSTAQRQQGQHIASAAGQNGQGQGGQQQYTTRQAYFTTPTPLTLPPHPPTLATLLPSLFPTPPPQPIYDAQAAVAAAQEPYEWSFDFAQGTPVVYCSYGASPIPVYNTPKKKCIPYHPLCGITFTCIFDVDPRTGHIWGQSRETRKKK